MLDHCGYGNAHAWKVRVGESSSLLSVDLSPYERPVISFLRGPGSINANARGGEIVFVHGFNLFGISIKLFYGPTGTEYEATDCIIFSPHDVVQCVSAEGTGSKHLYRISINGVDSILYKSPHGYSPPVLNDVFGTGADRALSSGGEQVHLRGKNFGPIDSPSTINATYFDEFEQVLYTASDCIRTASHTEITCFTAKGSGRNLKWSVHVDGLSSTSPSSSFLRPAVNDALIDNFDTDAVVLGRRRTLLQDNILLLNTTSMHTEGGDHFYIEGTNFGKTRFLPENSVTYGRKGREYAAKNCIVTSMEQKPRNLTIESCILRNGWMYSSEVSNSDNSTMIRTIAYGIYEAGTTSHSIENLLLLSNKRLLALCPDPKPENVSGTPGTIKCTSVAGGGANLHILVHIGGQSSPLTTRASLSYFPPKITKIDKSRDYTGNNVIIHVFGTQFGPEQSALVIFDGIQ